MVETILIFVVILAILIFVHEFGHFIVAKKSGMKVDEFGFGFPPRIAGIQRINRRWNWVWGHKTPSNPEQTVYSINWIPLGGFVKIVGENNDQEQDPRSFINKPFWPRFFTLVAGVVMNVALAWLLFSIGYVVGLPVAILSNSDIPAHAHFESQGVGITEVTPGSPAEKGGLKPDDIFVSIDGKSFSDSSQFRDYILSNEGKSFDFKIKRGGNRLDLKINSLANPAQGEGPTGISLGNVGKLKFPWYMALWEGAKTSEMQLVNITTGLAQLFSGKVSLANVGGPVKIAQLTGRVASSGFLNLLGFTGFLSLNLAVINILPFPALDGGRVLFLIIEKVRRKKNNQKVEQIFNTAGFLFLILVMVAVTIHDVINK